MSRHYVASIATATILALMLPGLASGQSAPPGPSGTPCPQKPSKDAAQGRQQTEKKSEQTDRQQSTKNRAERQKGSPDRSWRHKFDRKRPESSPDQQDRTRQQKPAQQHQQKPQRPQDCK